MGVLSLTCHSELHTGSSTESSTQLYTGEPTRLATVHGSAPPSPAARTPATCAAMGAGGERQPGIGQARVPVQVRSRRRAPQQPAGRPGGHAVRSRALGAPSTAVGRHACGRPRRGAVAAVLPHWSRRRRSPARWSAHARAATACKWPRSRSVVRTPEPRGERAMGAALTRPTGIASALARIRACGV